MPSIRQNAYPDLLPDLRNLAVMARVLVGVNALALAGTLYATPTLAAALDRFVYVAAFLEPLLLIARGGPPLAAFTAVTAGEDPLSRDALIRPA